MIFLMLYYKILQLCPVFSPIFSITYGNYKLFPHFLLVISKIVVPLQLITGIQTSAEAPVRLLRVKYNKRLLLFGLL